ncbi:unnamed protein product [Arctia plantaginis]|uniref:Uncharacterized protein n=1 Tax=Arctia plantaginis TaxID=874455 RepID=A0A8S0YYW0_ARCPL|nr:unnamed protein product [Arctia plantaginis]
MLLYTVAVIVAYLAMASSRETIRPMPTITNSLVNLGKMEISFYFNGNDRDSSSQHYDHVSRSMGPFIKPEPVIEDACPCSSLRNFKDLNNPAGILNKILMSNDLFSFNREPVTSTLCCESHEHVQDGTVIFEFPSNPKNMKPVARSNTVPVEGNSVPISNNGLPMLPFLFETAIPNKSMLPSLKTKSIEIFLFPKKKEMGIANTERLPSKKRDLSSKDNIQVVGDKDIKNNVNLFKPVFPVVKKDLTFQDKNEKLKEKELQREKAKEKEEMEKVEGNQIIIEPASKPNAV